MCHGLGVGGSGHVVHSPQWVMFSKLFLKLSDGGTSHKQYCFLLLFSLIILHDQSVDNISSFPGNLPVLHILWNTKKPNSTFSPGSFRGLVQSTARNTA